MGDKVTLALEGLHRTYPGLTESLAGSYSEAAAVVFYRHHTPPFEIEIVDSEVMSRAASSLFRAHPPAHERPMPTPMTRSRPPPIACRWQP